MAEDEELLEVKQWILASEVAKRLGCSKSKIGHMAKKKLLTRRGDMRYPWPQVKREFKEHQAGVQEKVKAVSDASGDQATAIDAKDISNLKGLDFVIAKLERGDKDGVTTAYQCARALNELIKAKQQNIKLFQMENETISLEEAESQAFILGRQHRDQWLNWPAQVALEMAEELEVDSHRLNSVLDKYVREHLDTIASDPTRFACETKQ